MIRFLPIQNTNLVALKAIDMFALDYAKGSQGELRPIAQNFNDFNSEI